MVVESRSGKQVSALQGRVHRFGEVAKNSQTSSHTTIRWSNHNLVMGLWNLRSFLYQFNMCGIYFQIDMGYFGPVSLPGAFPLNNAVVAARLAMTLAGNSADASMNI